VVAEIAVDRSPASKLHSLFRIFIVQCFVRFNKKAQLTQGLRATAPSIIPRLTSAAILDIIEPEIAAFDPPTPNTLA